MKTEGWITVSRDSYDYQIWLISQEVTELMSDRLGVDLSYEGQNLPAVLMLNFLEDPLWMELDAEYGTEQTKRTLATLKRARKLFARARAEVRNCPETAVEWWNNAAGQVRLLPRPTSHFIGESERFGAEGLEAMVEKLCDLYEGYIEHKPTRGKDRARRTALVLRAVFEVHTDIKPGKSSKYGAPSGAFSKLLDELFPLLGIKANFLTYTRYACELPDDDHTLCEVKKVLAGGPVKLT
jgi:hypothetical protein